jgi:hypothetical protein
LNYHQWKELFKGFKMAYSVCLYLARLTSNTKKSDQIILQNMPFSCLAVFSSECFTVSFYSRTFYSGFIENWTRNLLAKNLRLSNEKWQRYCRNTERFIIPGTPVRWGWGLKHTWFDWGWERKHAHTRLLSIYLLIYLSIYLFIYLPR